MNRRQISVAELRTELEAQGVTSREHFALVCPMCGTVQSTASLRRAGCAEHDLDGSVGFACVGRWTGAAAARDGKPADPANPGCDWSLGGLFKLHTLEVVVDGQAEPLFEVATPEQAKALEARDD